MSEARKSCPECGARLTVLDLVLAECDPRHQCPVCWNVIGVRAPERLERIKADVPGVRCRRPSLRRAA